MDYEKIVAAAIQAMKAADLNRFLVVCALVSDLYCPGCNPRQPLARDSNLARTATRSKIDTAKVAAAVRAELSRSKTTSQTKLTGKARRVTALRYKAPAQKRQ